MVEVYKPQIFFFEQQTDLIYDLSTEIYSLVHEKTQKDGIVRLGLSFHPDLESFYRNILQDITFPWLNTEIYQLEELVNGEKSLQDPIKTLIANHAVEFPKEVNYISLTQSKDAINNLYKNKIVNTEGDLFDVSILYVDENGGFCGYGIGNTLSHSEDSVRFNKDIYGENIYFSVNLEYIINSGYVFLVTANRDVADEIVNGSRSVLDFPAKALLLNKNLFVYTTLV